MKKVGLRNLGGQNYSQQLMGGIGRGVIKG